MSKFVFYGLLIAVSLAVFIAPFASKSPDGLEKVAGDKGFLEKGETAVVSSPLADYSILGIKNKKLSTALSGVIGVIIIFGAVSFFGRLLKK
jgi:cobalt/nickel transport protein